MCLTKKWLGCTLVKVTHYVAVVNLGVTEPERGIAHGHMQSWPRVLQLETRCQCNCTHGIL